jgi:cysteine desulfuration protein SufE
MTINEVQDQIIDDFEILEDQNDKYEYLIELSKNLLPLDSKYKVPENLINGCQSRVWLNVEEENGILHFMADSDAQIPKGIVSLLVGIYNNRTAEEILNSELYFVDKIGLKQMLSPTRSNGLTSMVKQIRMYALAFKTRHEQNL